MAEPLISSRRNPLVKRLRTLSSRAGRDEAGLLLLEGTHLLQELLLIGGQPTELIATAAWVDGHADLIQALDASVVWRPVTEAVLEAALSTVTPDGVACLCSITLLPEPPKTCDFWLVLDRIQDPGNLGSLLRSALAADVESVWMGCGVDPLGGKP